MTTLFFTVAVMLGLASPAYALNKTLFLWEVGSLRQIFFESLAQRAFPAHVVTFMQDRSIGECHSYFDHGHAIKVSPS